MVELYCIGGLSLDLLLKIPRFPIPDEKLVIQYAGHHPGGLIANAACTAARLGLKTAWYGLVGDDQHSSLLMNAFISFGVDVSNALIQPNSPTDLTVILLHPDGERTILVVPLLPSPPPLSAALKQALLQSRVAYTLPYTQDWFLELAATMHSAGGKVAIDLEGCMHTPALEMEDILGCTDIVFCSKDGVQAFTVKSQCDDGADAILSLGPELVVLTLGKQGSRLISRTAQYARPAFQVPIVDRTGAGDCFHAAFLYGLLADWDLQICLQFASAAAAISVQYLGTRGGLPTADEVHQFLESYKS